MKRNNSIFTLFAICSLATASAVDAEISNIAKPVTASNSAHIELASTIPSEKMIPGAQLRCWQDGTLIFEENGLSDHADKPLKGHLRFTKEASDHAGKNVALIEVGSSLCMFKHD